MSRGRTAIATGGLDAPALEVAAGSSRAGSEEAA